MSINANQILLLKQITKRGLLLVLFCSVLQLLTATAQEVKITYISDGLSLSSVLDDIIQRHDIKLAYDFDSFEKIETNFSIEDYSTEQFLSFLRTEYFINARNVEGTWILVIDYERKQAHDRQIKIKENIPENIVLNGFVRDAATNHNLMYCNVVTGDYRGTMTNDLGYFNMEMPASDSARIRIIHLGYKHLDTLVFAKEPVLIHLQPADILMEAIEVTHYEKDVLAMAPQPEKVAFNPAKSKNIPRISNDDVGNALLLIPGIDFVHGGTAGLSVRGSLPTDNLVLFDGIPVLETNHLLGNMSVLNSKYVQQVFVARGGFDSEYGGRVGGLIELVGKTGQNSTPYLDFSANLLNTNLLASVPISETVSFTAAWRRSFIDQWPNYLYYRLVDDSDGDEVSSAINPTIKYQDVNAKISFSPSAKSEFNLNFLYGNDLQSRDFSLFNTGDYYRNEYVDGNNIGFSFNWKWQVKPNWYNSLSAGYSKMEKDNEDETGELEEVTEIIENPGQGQGKGKGLLKTKEKTYTRFAYDLDRGSNELEEYRVNWKSEIKLGKFRNQAGLGWSANSYSYNFYASRTTSEFPVDSIQNNASRYLFNAFVQQYVSLNNNLEFRWGVRSNVDINSGKIFLQPRGGIEFAPSENLKFNLSSGIYHQFLSGIKRFDSDGHFNQVWFLPGDDGEGIVKAQHHIAGLKFNKNGWDVNIEGYYKNTKGRMNLYAETLYLNNEESIEYISRESKEQNSGVDFFIQKRHGFFNHMLAYSFATNEEQIDGYFNDEWIPAYNDRMHRLKFTEMFRWKNWTLTGNWEFASGLPVTDFTDVSSSAQTSRTDYFSQLNFSITRRINVKHLNVNAGVSFLNVLNRENIVEVDFLRFSSATESLSVRSDISALEFTPIFFIDVKVY